MTLHPQTPHQALFGTIPRSALRHYATPAVHCDPAKLHEIIELLQTRAQQNSNAAHQALAQSYAKKAQAINTSFTPGEIVMIYDQAPDHKLRPRWRAGYKVISQPNPKTLEVTDPVHGRIQKVRIEAVRRFNTTRAGMAEIIDSILLPEHYYVESVLNHKYNDDGQLMLQIRWLGYDSTGDTWEPYGPNARVKVIDDYVKERHLSPNLKTARQPSSGEGNESI
jgi:hypothetical protein